MFIPDDLPLKNPFWLHSLELWKNRELQTLLLDLQNQQGYRINLLLVAIWLAFEQRDFSKLIHSCLTQTQDWHEKFVTPLRLMRQTLPKTPEASNNLRKHLQQSELLAEQIEQALLFNACKAETQPSQKNHSITDYLIINLRASKLKESELSLVILACIPSLTPQELKTLLAQQPG